MGVFSWRAAAIVLIGALASAAAVVHSSTASAGGAARPCVLNTALDSVAALKAASGRDRDVVTNEYTWVPAADVRAFFTGPKTIEVYFHVIRDSAGGPGDISDQSITDQIQVMNDAYAGTGAAAGSVDTGFRFHLAGVDRTTNPDWYWDLLPDSGEEQTMKTALHEGGYDALNLYSASLGAGLLGWATFPETNPSAFTLATDGLVLLDESLPGGDAEGSGGEDYHEGDTATHEIGHWLFLYHTFEGGCSGSGDHVSDTPAEADPNFECTPIDSCPGDGQGPDLIDDFMDYGDDVCLDMFTPGQRDRMQSSWDTFRQGTGGGGGGGGGGGDTEPTVKKFKPEKGFVGTHVKITGSGFAGTQTVTFGGISATFRPGPGGSLDAVVPAGAGTGLISVANGAGTATSKKPFKVKVK